MTTSLVEAPKLHPEETPNTPLPVRGGVWGKNRLMGLVVPNVEKVSEGGIIISETKTHQNIPHVCTLVQVSESVDADDYPLLAWYKHQYDRENRGNVFVGPQLLYIENAGYEWDFPEGSNSCTWVQLDAKNILRWFPAFEADTSKLSEEGRKAYERYEKMLKNLEWYIENVQSK